MDAPHGQIAPHDVTDRILHGCWATRRDARVVRPRHSDIGHGRTPEAVSVPKRDPTGADRQSLGGWTVRGDAAQMPPVAILRPQKSASAAVKEQTRADFAPAPPLKGAGPERGV